MTDFDSPSQVPPSQELFTDEWQIYRKMVDNDYLFHKDAYACLGTFLRESVDRPFDFLDLACGDASMTVKALLNTKIDSYEGVDISSQALDIARETLTNLNCTVVLQQADFVDFVHTRKTPVDIVWIGLSLHHLQREAKREAIQAIRHLMRPNGCLLIYENTSSDGESRDAWLRRWDDQESQWTAYTPSEWAYVTAHVHQADFPETASDWQALGREAGYRTINQLFASPTDLFRLYAYVPH